MPQVNFVNECRVIDVPAGRLLSEIARDHGVAVARLHFARTRIGNYTVWIQGEPGAVSPPGLFERLLGSGKGWKRLANRTRVLGDVRVWTQQGIATRVGVQREIASPPRPSDDASAERFDHEHDPAGTAWNPFGHPRAVGRGVRDAPVPDVPVKPVDKAAAAKASTSASAPVEAAAKKPVAAAATAVASAAADGAKDVDDKRPAGDAAGTPAADGGEAERG